MRCRSHSRVLDSDDLRSAYVRRFQKWNAAVTASYNTSKERSLLARPSGEGSGNSRSGWIGLCHILRAAGGSVLGSLERSPGLSSPFVLIIALR